MIHLGDITKMTTRNTPPVDCITFGSPCQDLSIAGKRAGLDGERSGLFMDAVRVIESMYIDTLGQFPKFAVWENVPGAFSSNKGEDFRVVLEELAHIKEPEVSIPRPENGKWAKAGLICGNGWSIAWRTFDAQFWGVPQRRRRIALVLDLRGQRAGEILFERTGVRRDSEPSIPPWQGVARNPAHRTAGHDRVVGEPGAFTLKIRSGCEGGGKGPLIQTEKSATLSTLRDQTLFVMQGNMIDREVKQNGAGIVESEIMFTLNTTDRHGVCCLLNDQGGQSMAVEDGRVSPTLRAESHAHEPIICAAFVAGQGAKAKGIGWAEEQAPTLRTDGGLSAMPTVLCRAQANTNAETYDNLSPTITACHDGPPIVFENHAQDARYTQLYNVMSTMVARCGTGGNNMPLVAFTQNQRDEVRDLNDVAGALAAEPGMKQRTYIAEKALTPLDNQARRVYHQDGAFPALAAREHAGQNQQSVLIRTILHWIVRRLTPTECERLQGFPAGWTDIGDWTDSKGKRHKAADSPKYKALGNSIALPQWWWITCKMARYLPEHATLGSLFDGIGGFPLVWETRHGKGTAVWASEIEEFPIAVTKARFPE